MRNRLLSIYTDTKALIDYYNQLGLRWRDLIFPVVLSFLSSAFEGFSFLLLMPTIKGVLGGNYLFIKSLLKEKLSAINWDVLFSNNSRVLLILFGLIFLSIVFKSIFLYFSDLLISIQTRRFSNVLRKKIYARYLSFGKEFFERNSQGHLQQVLIGFTSRVAQEILCYYEMLSKLFDMIIYIGLMFFVAPYMSVWTLIIFPVLYFCFKSFIKYIKISSEAYTQHYVDISKKISNALQCIPLIKSYSSESREEKCFNTSSDGVEHDEIAVDKMYRLIGPVQEIIIYAGLLLLMGIIAYSMKPGNVREIAHFLIFFVVLKRAMNSFGVFNKMLSTTASLSGPIGQIKEVFCDQEKFFVKNGTLHFQGHKQTIVLDNVFFRYSSQNVPSEDVLRGLNLTFHKGEIVAIVGASGSGKSTLVSLLLRFYDPTQGVIRLDGVDIRQYTLESLHEHMTLISQETYILNDTFRVNLIYGLKVEPSHSEMMDVLERASLKELVASWPQGLDAQIGERGVNLSGGERQRLAIARALLKKSEIMIMDEATSALDSTTENLIQTSLYDLLKGKTCIVIAHRFSTIRHADRIIVLEAGKIVEEGTVDQLLGEKRKFYEYWVQQKFV